MALAAGTRLGPYEILEPLGAGGMGEVYRAADPKLGRDVAIKILPSAVTGDSQRLARFQREAHLLASLNHPNIATVYGLEEADGQPFLVLELVEGGDLRQRLRKGALPLEEALQIAKQIAEALEEAHAHGIVHRDLKPANVKLTPEGRVKVLDFGLAKAYRDRPGPEASPEELAPTLAQSGTQAGVVLGTAAYMSPQQASGEAVDKRADIWSFGVVLFEMLTGRRLFNGETASEILASVIKDEPDWERVPDNCPPSVARLLRRCLRKRPRERLQDIGDARLELEDTLGGRTDDVGCSVVGTGERLEAERRAKHIAAAASVVLGGLVVFLSWRDLGRPPPVQPVVRLDLLVPAELSPPVALDVSPDGRHVALSPLEPSPFGGLWIRSLDASEARRLPGTEGAFEGFWSPDGASLAFWAHEGNKVALKRVELATGTFQTLSHIDGSTWGATWGEQDVILVSAKVSQRSGVHSVPAVGGAPQALALNDGPRHRTPQFLPDGRSFIYGVESADQAAHGTWLASLDPPHRERLILPGGMQARYAGSGHLLFVRDGTLLAQSFDTDRGELTGAPHAIAASVEWFSASQNGVLIYRQTDDTNRELVWFDRTGNRLGTVGQAAPYLEIQLSPDGRSVVAETGNPVGNTDLWTIDIKRGVATRATIDPGRDHDAVWSPDGAELYFSSARGGEGKMRLHRKRLNGLDAPSLLLNTEVNAYAAAVSPDGKALLYLSEPTNNLWALPLGDGGEPELLIEADYFINAPSVSPDGRWLAYGSNETGAWEVYVAPFMRDGERMRVSTGGGRHPRWRGDGRELFFVSPREELMVAALRETGNSMEVGSPRPLFNIGVNFSWSDEYDVARDGQSFLAIAPLRESSKALNVILNWPSLIE